VRVTHGAEAVERTYNPLQLLTETSDAVLRALSNDVRARQVASQTDYIPCDDRDLEFTGLANCLMGHAQRALSTPETEVAQDEWDLTVFGQNGTVSFTGISQPWLREAAKRWAADDLPKTCPVGPAHQRRPGGRPARRRPGRPSRHAHQHRRPMGQACRTRLGRLHSRPCH
jgi:hypothetical protein